MRQLFVLILLSTFTACMKRPIKADAPLAPPIVRNAYTIQEQHKPNTYFVWLYTPTAEAAAKKEIGCGICTVTPAGVVIYVEHFKAKEK